MLRNTENLCLSYQRRKAKTISHDMSDLPVGNLGYANFMVDHFENWREHIPAGYAQKKIQWKFNPHNALHRMRVLYDALGNNKITEEFVKITFFVLERETSTLVSSSPHNLEIMIINLFTLHNQLANFP